MSLAVLESGHTFPVVLAEEVVVAVEPFFGGGIVGAGGLDEVPEFAGVVHLAQVHEFVEDEVIADGGGCLNQAPVQRDGALRGTGTPAGVLVADEDAADGDLVQRGKFQGARGKFFCGEPPKMKLDDGPEIRS